MQTAIGAGFDGDKPSEFESMPLPLMVVEGSQQSQDHEYHELKVLQASHTPLEVAIACSRALTDSEKYELLMTVQDIADDKLDTRSFTFGSGRKQKQITLQKKMAS